jgi:glycosyltransferase involved in cell wall biosynthesis
MEKFDVCIIAFVDVSTDARTVNISSTFVKNGLKTCIISIGDQDAIAIRDDITYYTIAINPNTKTWQRWLDFYRKVSIVAFDIEAPNVIAEDVYSLPMAAEFKKRCKSKMIYDSREIYSALGSLSGRSFKQWIISYIEKRNIKKVDRIVVTGTRDEEYLRQNLTDSKPYYLVRNLPPYKDRILSDKLRQSFNIPDTNKILVYQGMLMEGRGLQKSIEAISLIDNVSFVMLGDGPLKSQLKKKINELNLDARVFLAGAVDYNDLHEWTCSADIGLSLIEPVSKSYELALPNKMFEYIMAGIPTLCSDLPAMKEIVEQYKIGNVLPPDCSSDDIADAIKHMLLNLEEYCRNCIPASRQLCFGNQESTVMELVG